ncbi:zinc-binding dehydrogenase [Nocardioides cavernae]|uniref:zinc-binding dehydrogenase n=1 Tax=Nocardioides cavernae TaxID=1921566 RepID=UPI0015C85E50|nr:alcohol dehydrogenase catalytic domain-containing protein [Nocardioides cavernae]
MAEPGPEDAVLGVEAVGICGTDLHIFDGSYATRLPLVQGHEVSGLVERLPASYDGPLAVGDRVAVEPVTSCGTCVACRRGRRNTCCAMDAVGVHRPGGLQQRLVVPVRNLHPAHDLPPDVTALCETLSIGLRAVTRPAVTAADSVVVLGAGPVGLAAVIAARDVGAEVMVADLHPARLALARDLGAAHGVQGVDDLQERVEEWTAGDGASVVVEATGAARVAEQAFEVVAMAGRISMVGVSEQRMSLPVKAIQAKELDVLGSRATLDFPGAVALAARHRDDVRRLVSHRFPLAEARAAVELALHHPQGVVKALIEVC